MINGTVLSREQDPMDHGFFWKLEQKNWHIKCMRLRKFNNLFGVSQFLIYSTHNLQNNKE